VFYNLFKKIVFTLILSVSGTIYWAHSQEQPKPQGIKKITIPKGKQLHSNKLKDINVILTIKPFGIVRMMAAYLAAQNILGELSINTIKPEDEKEYIKKHLREILEPIKEFFEIVRDCKEIVVPLFKESFNIPPATPITSTSSPLLRYFDSKLDTFQFFEQEIQTVPEFKSVCSDFSLFFIDLWANLKKDAKEAYVNLMKEISKQATQNTKK
jgi:hypothetical protein